MTRSAVLVRSAAALAAALLAGCGAETDPEGERSAASSAPPQAERAQALLDAAVRKQQTLNEGAYAVRLFADGTEGNDGLLTLVAWDLSLGIAAGSFQGEAEGATVARVVEGRVWTAKLQAGGSAGGCWSGRELRDTFAAAPGASDLDPAWPLDDVLEKARAVEAGGPDGKALIDVEQVVQVEVPAQTLAALVLSSVSPVALEGAGAERAVPARVVLQDGRLNRIEVDPAALTSTGDAAVDRLAASAQDENVTFRVEISPTAENLRVATPQPACR
jgi:hypothetical protein